MAFSSARLIGRPLVALALAAFGFVADAVAAPGPSTVAPTSGRGSMLVGPARVSDGDTIVINGVRVRLEGIDAPETGQQCTHKWMGSWSCGATASTALARLIGDSEVVCENRGTDKYGRMLGVCFVGDKDINAEMVRSGMAWAFVKYSNLYVAEEAAARAAKVGVWQAETQTAWDYRAARWTTAEVKTAAAPEGCVIKGAVTKNGRIYHMPWSPWYDKVRIEDDPAKRGERRWFCTEAEAEAAGWRPVMMR